MLKEQAVYDILENLAIPFRIDEAYTNASKDYKTVLMTSASKDETYLVLAPIHKINSPNSLSTHIADNNLQMVTDEVLYKSLKLSADAISPFGLIYDINKKIHVIIDKEVVSKQEIRLQANVSHTHIIVSSKNLTTFLDWLPNQVEYLDL